jgi:hypothetical protein
MTVTGTPLPANGEGTDDSFPPPGPILVVPANGRYGARAGIAIDGSERRLWVEAGHWAADSQ